MSAATAPVPKAPKTDIVSRLIDACRRNDGKYVLMEGQEGEFETVLTQGGRHAICNNRQPDGTFKNQAVLAKAPGEVLVFEIFSRRPLNAIRA